MNKLPALIVLCTSLTAGQIVGSGKIYLGDSLYTISDSWFYENQTDTLPNGMLEARRNLVNPQSTGNVSVGSYNWQPANLHFYGMIMNLRTGEIVFSKPVDQTAKAFAVYVANHYSAYVDSLKKEIIQLKKRRRK